MAELIGSDFSLIGAVLVGLALTALAIVRDLGRFRSGQADEVKLLGQEPQLV